MLKVEPEILVKSFQTSKQSNNEETGDFLVKAAKKKGKKNKGQSHTAGKLSAVWKFALGMCVGSMIFGVSGVLRAMQHEGDEQRASDESLPEHVTPRS